MPTIDISNIPTGTKSLAYQIEDTDAPNGFRATGNHKFTH